MRKLLIDAIVLRVPKDTLQPSSEYGYFSDEDFLDVWQMVFPDRKIPVKHEPRETLNVLSDEQLFPAAFLV